MKLNKVYELNDAKEAEKRFVYKNSVHTSITRNWSVEEINTEQANWESNII